MKGFRCCWCHCVENPEAGYIITQKIIPLPWTGIANEWRNWNTANVQRCTCWSRSAKPAQSDRFKPNGWHLGSWSHSALDNSILNHILIISIAIFTAKSRLTRIKNRNAQGKSEWHRSALKGCTRSFNQGTWIAQSSPEHKCLPAVWSEISVKKPALWTGL